ncbi:MAG: hypothetical protein ACT4NU_04660 [Chromatiales bacterium]
MKILLMLGSLLWACAIGAAGGFMPWTGVMHLADTDGDGMISMDEVREFSRTGEYTGFQPFMADHFMELDRNSDDMISGEELKSGMMKMGMSDEDLAHGFKEGFGFMQKH